MKHSKEFRQLIEVIQGVIDEVITEKSKKGKRKRGGALTPLGALHVLKKPEFLRTMNDAIHNAQGDEEETADELGVSKSLVRHYQDKYPQLAAAQAREEEKAEEESEVEN